MAKVRRERKKTARVNPYAGMDVDMEAHISEPESDQEVQMDMAVDSNAKKTKKDPLHPVVVKKNGELTRSQKKKLERALEREKQRMSEMAEEAALTPEEATQRQIKKRQSQEWRAAKAEVAKLKRMRLQVKGSAQAHRDERRKLGKQIKEVLATTMEKHKAEREMYKMAADGLADKIDVDEI